MRRHRLPGRGAAAGGRVGPRDPDRLRPGGGGAALVAAEADRAPVRRGLRRRQRARHAPDGRDGTYVSLPPVAGKGAQVVQPLPPGLRGIFVVSWSLLSDDGHLVAGDFAFSVGTSGALPAASTSASSPRRSEVVASWLFFLGLSLALGGILSERLVWRDPPVRAPALLGIGIAIVASLAFFVLLSGDRANGGVTAGLHAHALKAVAQSRPGALTLAVLAALLVAAVLAAVRRTRVAALVPLAAAGTLVAVRGHAGTSGDWWAPLAEAVHLLAAAAWTGALAHLVLVLFRAPDAPLARRAPGPPVRRARASHRARRARHGRAERARRVPRPLLGVRHGLRTNARGEERARGGRARARPRQQAVRATRESRARAPASPPADARRARGRRRGARRGRPARQPRPAENGRRQRRGVPRSPPPRRAGPRSGSQASRGGRRSGSRRPTTSSSSLCCPPGAARSRASS